MTDYRLPDDCEDWDEFAQLPDERKTEWFTEERCRRQFERQLQAKHGVSLDTVLQHFIDEIDRELERIRRRERASGYVELKNYQ